MKNLLAKNIRRYFENMENMKEIRLRIGMPIIYYKEKEYVTNHILTSEELNETLQLMSGFSLYAYENEIRNGFFTIEGGHRIGIVGNCVIENKKVKTIKDFSSINIRINKEIKGCSNNIINEILIGDEIFNTCIISPPNFGKTTMLRDIIRSLANKFKIAVVDERGEIAASHLGIPKNDIGIRTDVLTGCPKKIGMEMVLRSMSPEIIAVDEISFEEKEEIKQIKTAGVKIICTMHGSKIDEAKKLELEKYILLGKNYKIKEIF